MIRYYDCHTQEIALRLGYRAGKLFRIERTKGQLSLHQWRRLGCILPPREEDIGSYSLALKGRVVYRVQLAWKTPYEAFVQLWFSFFEDYNGFKPCFDGAQGKALKGIISKLKALTGGEHTQTLAIWEQLLCYWHKLDTFHQKNTDLKYINGNLNKILTQIRHASQKDKTPGSAYGVEL